MEACLSSDALDPAQAVIALRDLALSGFSIVSDQAAVVSRQYEFKFATEAGLAVRVRAVAVYSRPSDGPQGHTFVNGFKFVADSPAAEAAIDLLVDSATAPLTFD